jgi:hypothetical protein
METANAMPTENPNAADSSPSPDKPPEGEKSKPLAWADLPTVLSGIAVFLTVLVSLGTAFVFLLSCLSMYSREKALGFSAIDYVDFDDYVKTLPIVDATVGVLLALFIIFFIMIAVVMSWVVVSLPVSLRFIPEKDRNRSLGRLMLNVLVVGLTICTIIILWLAFTDGDRLKKSLLSAAVSKVFRKSDDPPIEGVLFLHTGRYIFLWKDNRAVVVPNAEVKMIETPSSLPSVSSAPTPVIVSPVKPITPSQMSPTLMPK